MDLEQLKDRIVALGIVAQQAAGQHPGQKDGVLWDTGAALIRMGQQLASTKSNDNVDDAVVQTNCSNKNRVPYRVPVDFLDHQLAWRTSLELSMKNSSNEDERSYWQHEIRTFDLAYSELRSMFISIIKL